MAPLRRVALTSRNADCSFEAERRARRSSEPPLPSGDCESEGRDGERGATGQHVHALPMQTPEQEGPGRPNAPRPTQPVWAHLPQTNPYAREQERRIRIRCAAAG